MSVNNDLAVVSGDVTTVRMRTARRVTCAAGWQRIEDDGFIGLVGPIFYLPFEDGVGRFRFSAEAKHQNRSGFVQGGMLMTFADRALGMTARNGYLPRRQATVQLSMDFARTVTIGEDVEMECRVSGQGHPVEGRNC